MDRLIIALVVLMVLIVEPFIWLYFFNYFLGSALGYSFWPWLNTFAFMVLVRITLYYQAKNGSA